MKHLFSALALTLSLLLSPVAARAEDAAPAVSVPRKNETPLGATRREIELGKKASEEIEKNPKVKLVDGKKDPAAKALLEKLNAMATQLGKASARPQINYTIKIIDDTDLNAFTLPGGHIYIYRGLLDAAGSDDEIAAVLSHEIGHNARMHSVRGQSQAKKMSLVSLAALAAMLFGGKSGQDVGQFSQYVLTGIMSGYSVNYEKEADLAAIEQMKQTSYNPSALVSFMQRMDQEEKRRPEIEMGIFRTHPPTPEREAAALKALAAAGLPFTPRAVAGAKQATANESKEKDRVIVKFGSTTLMELATTPDLTAAKARGQKIADRINSLMRANLKLHEINAEEAEKNPRLLARGEEIARVSPDDAKLQSAAPNVIARKWRDNFRRLFWRESINGAL